MYTLLYLLFFVTINSFTNASKLEESFTQAYHDSIAGKYGLIESTSGPGSTLEQTEVIRSLLPSIIKEFNITSIVDAPCGDFYWMQHVNLLDCSYLGIDVVIDLIKANQEKFESSQRHFVGKNLLSDPLPQADLIISRDFLVHLSNADVCKALRNFKKSGSKYLLTTSFPNRQNCDIESGSWRPINLEQAPFNLPKPIVVINENCTEQNGNYADKSLMLWNLNGIII